MKNINFILLLSYLLLLSCVSKSDYDKLKTENEKLKKELDELRFGDTKLYNEATLYFNEKSYKKSKDAAKLLIEKHPSSLLTSKAKALVSKIDSIDESTRRHETALKISIEKELNKNISQTYDDFQKCTFYESTRNTYQAESNDRQFQVEIYIVKSDIGKKWLRLRTRYIASDWIFYELVTLLGDNNIQIETVTKYPNKKTDVGGGVAEWSDNNIDSDLVLKLNESKEIKFRFDGQYRFSMTMNANQRAAFNEIVQRYKSL